MNDNNENNNNHNHNRRYLPYVWCAILSAPRQADAKDNIKLIPFSQFLYLRAF